jgi:pimeloyl-ACP methyl ester carboxylesterase
MPRASINGVNLYYEVQGEGYPLFLVQGFGGGGKGWRLQVRAFRKHFRTVVFDSRGIDKSEKPREPYTIKDLADDITGLMDHLGMERAHILGMSFGSIVAQEFAISHADRVNRLVLACASYGEDDPNEVHPEIVSVFGGAKGPEVFDPASVDFEHANSVVINMAFNKRFYRMLFGPVSKWYVKTRGIEGHRAQIQAVAGHKTLDRLHLIASPTLVLTGTEDKIIPPKNSEIIASHIPNARLVKIEGGSHALSIEHRKEFNAEVLRFLLETDHEIAQASATTQRHG